MHYKNISFKLFEHFIRNCKVKLANYHSIKFKMSSFIHIPVRMLTERERNFRIFAHITIKILHARHFETAQLNIHYPSVTRPIHPYKNTRHADRIPTHPLSKNISTPPPLGRVSNRQF